MLNNLWLSTALYAYPSFNFYINLYQTRLKSCKNISIDAFADCDTDKFVQKLEDLRTKADNLAVLKNAVQTALGLLDEKKREVIKLFYFKNLTGTQIVERLGIDYNTYRYRKRAAMRSLSLYLFMLGMTNERFLQYFDEDQFIVRVCEELLQKKLIHITLECKGLPAVHKLTLKLPKENV